MGCPKRINISQQDLSTLTQLVQLKLTDHGHGVIEKMAKYKKGKLKATETHAEIFEKLAGGSGGSRSRLKIQKRKKKYESEEDRRVLSQTQVENILEDHGHDFERVNDTGKVRAYSTVYNRETLKTTRQQKTFNNPLLGELKDWLGY